ESPGPSATRQPTSTTEPTSTPQPTIDSFGTMSALNAVATRVFANQTAVAIHTATAAATEAAGALHPLPPLSNISRANAPTAGGAQATGVGCGTVSTAQFGGDPAGSPRGVFSNGTYFDVNLAPSSTFTSVMIKLRGGSGTVAYWWNGAAWLIASPQSYADGTV